MGGEGQILSKLFDAWDVYPQGDHLPARSDFPRPLEWSPWSCIRKALFGFFPDGWNVLLSACVCLSPKQPSSATVAFVSLFLASTSSLFCKCHHVSPSQGWQLPWGTSLSNTHQLKRYHLWLQVSGHFTPHINPSHPSSQDPPSSQYKPPVITSVGSALCCNVCGKKMEERLTNTFACRRWFYIWMQLTIKIVAK